MSDLWRPCHNWWDTEDDMKYGPAPLFRCSCDHCTSRLEEIRSVVTFTFALDPWRRPIDDPLSIGPWCVHCQLTQEVPGFPEHAQGCLVEGQEIGHIEWAEMHKDPLPFLEVMA